MFPHTLFYLVSGSSGLILMQLMMSANAYTHTYYHSQLKCFIFILYRLYAQYRNRKGNESNESIDFILSLSFSLSLSVNPFGFLVILGSCLCSFQPWMVHYNINRELEALSHWLEPERWRGLRHRSFLTGLFWLCYLEALEANRSHHHQHEKQCGTVERQMLIYEVLMLIDLHYILWYQDTGFHVISVNVSLYFLLPCLLFSLEKCNKTKKKILGCIYCNILYIFYLNI